MSQEREGPEVGTSWTLDEGIAEWRSYLRRRPAIHAVDVAELEDHLRSQAGALVAAGLAEDEAFLIAVKRIGELDALSREFAREHSERLWKRLVVAPDERGGGGAAVAKDALVAVALAIAAAVAIKLPALFGVRMDPNQELPELYVRNLGLFVLPLLAAFFAWKRSLPPVGRLWLAAPFVAAAVAMNLMPFAPEAHTLLLAAMHVLIALWLAVGYAYAGGRWRDHEARMNYVRFSGEWFIYYALIALGGGVLMGLTGFVFSAIGFKPEVLLTTWILPCGAVGAVLVAAWLVEAKQSVIENMAPVLTLIFTPLFTLLLLAFLATMAWTGSSIVAEREVLIGFDLLLVVVAGLVLYAISARDPLKAPGPFDALQLALIVCALLVDAVALWAIAGRISDYGFSPNKVAALGENIILLVNLGWSAVLYARFLTGRAPFAKTRAVADGVRPGVRAVGVDGGAGVPAAVRLQVARPGSRRGPACLAPFRAPFAHVAAGVDVGSLEARRAAGAASEESRGTGSALAFLPRCATGLVAALLGVTEAVDPQQNEASSGAGPNSGGRCVRFHELLELEAVAHRVHDGVLEHALAGKVGAPAGLEEGLEARLVDAGQGRPPALEQVLQVAVRLATRRRPAPAPARSPGPADRASRTATSCSRAPRERGDGAACAARRSRGPPSPAGARPVSPPPATRAGACASPAREAGRALARRASGTPEGRESACKDGSTPGGGQGLPTRHPSRGRRDPRARCLLGHLGLSGRRRSWPGPPDGAIRRRRGYSRRGRSRRRGSRCAASGT